MTGQYTLFFTILAHDWSWVTWVKPLVADVRTGPLARALRVNTDQLKAYFAWLVDHGYMTVEKRRRGLVRIEFTQLNKHLCSGTSLLNQSKAAGGSAPQRPVAGGPK